MSKLKPIFKELLSEYSWDKFKGDVKGAAKGIGVAYINWRVDSMQDHVGCTEHVRQSLLFDAVNAIDQSLLVLSRLDIIFSLMVNGACEEATSTASWVEHAFSELRVDTVDDELGDGSWGIKFTSIPCALQILEDLLINAPKSMAIFGVVEIDFVDLIDNLANQRA